MHPAGLQAGINDGDFKDVDVVGVDDQRPVGGHPGELGIVDAADQIGQTSQGTNKEAL